MPTTIVANLQLNTTAAQRQLAQFNQKISRGLGQPLGRITGDAAEFQKSLSAAAARVSAFGAVTGVLVGVSRAISGAAQATVQINKDLVELNTFLGQSTAEVNRFGQEIFKISRRTASDFKTVAEAAKEFARQGLSTQETLERTNSALILSRISGLGFAEAVTSITTAINTFNKSAIDSTQIVDKLIAVDTRFAVSSNQIAQALSRVGSSAEESGLSLDQLIATVTAVQQITGRGGSVIGNSLKTIFTRIRRPEVIEQLQSIGVTVKDQNGALLDGITVLQNYANATKNLSQVEKSRTAELLGGVFQINQLQAIIRDLTSANSIYASSLKISENASDDAIKKNDQLNQSYSALFARTRANLTELGGAVGDNLFGPLLAGGANAINELANIIKGNTELPEAVGQSLGKSVGIIGTDLGKKIIAGIGNTLGTAGPALAGILGTALTIKVGAFAARSVLGLGRSISQGAATAVIGKKRIAEEQRILQLVQNTEQVTDEIAKGNLNISQYENIIRNSIREQNTLLANQLSIAKQLAATGLGKVTAISNVPGQSRQTRTAVITPRIPRRSSGYVPAFAKEESQARSLGAVNPRAGVINATIRGRTGPVIVNDQESVFNVGGETAIVPNYRSLDKIPNFARGASILKFFKNKLGGTGKTSSDFDLLQMLFQQLASVGAVAPLFLGPAGASSNLQLGLGAGLAGAGGLAAATRVPKGTSLGRRALAGIIGSSSGLPLAATGFIQKFAGAGIKRAQGIQAEEDRIADEFNKSTNKLQDLTETLTKLDNAFKDASSTPDQLLNLSKKVNQLTSQITDPNLASRIALESSPQAQLELIQDAQNKATRRRSLQETVLGFQSLSERDAESTGRFFQDLITLIDKSDPDSIKVVTDFFDKQSKETQSILVPAFARAFRADKEIAELREKGSNELSKTARDVIRKISDLRVSSAVRGAREKAFEKGVGSAEQIASLFGESASIDFKTRAATLGVSKQAKRSFFASVSSSGLTGDLANQLRSIGPSQEAANIIQEELKRANGPMEKALQSLASQNDSLLRELEKANRIAEQDAEIQRKILTIRQAADLGGGIGSSLSGAERAKAINAPLKGALQFRLGGMMGSRRSQIAGLTNFLSAIEEQVPGATANSPGLRAVRERLTGLRQSDLQSDLLRNARIAGSLGLGGVGASLGNLANTPSALRNIAQIQASKALPGGQAPAALGNFLNTALNDYISGLSQQSTEDRQLKSLETQRESMMAPILKSVEKDTSKITDSLRTSLEKGLNQVKTVVITNPGEVKPQAASAARPTSGVNWSVPPSNFNMSGGFIPSFANPLRDAISRESQYVPSSTIRVNQSNKLRNRANPMGLAVTNTIDEPNGLASIGLASGGFVPNFALFGDQVRINTLESIKGGKAYIYDMINGVFYKIAKNNRILYNNPLLELPYDAKIISTELTPTSGGYTFPKTERLLNLRAPGLTKLDVLNKTLKSGKLAPSALPAMPSAMLLDDILKSNLSSRGASGKFTSGKSKPQKILDIISQKLGGEAVIKTAFGESNLQSRGVFGHLQNLNIDDVKKVQNMLKTGQGSGFFAESKVPLFGDEFRVHVNVDPNGTAKLVQGGTIGKRGGIQALMKSGYTLEQATEFYNKAKQAAERTALQNIARLAEQSNKLKLGSNYFFGLDVGTSLFEAAKKAGVKNSANAFTMGKDIFMPVIHEINQSDTGGSSGYIGKGVQGGQRVDVLKSLLNQTLDPNAPKGTRGKLNPLLKFSEVNPNTFGSKLAINPSKASVGNRLKQTFSGKNVPLSKFSKGLNVVFGLLSGRSIISAEDPMEKASNIGLLSSVIGTFMKSSSASKLGGLLQGGGMGLFGGIEGIRFLKNVYNAKNFQIASSSDKLGLLGDFAGDALLALGGGPVGASVAVASASYKAGNLIEESLGMGDFLGGLIGDYLNVGSTTRLRKILESKKESRVGEKSRRKLPLNQLREQRLRNVKIAKRGQGNKVGLVRKPFDPFESYRKKLVGLGYTDQQARAYISALLNYQQKGLLFNSYNLSERYSNFSSGYVPNFAEGAMAEMMDIATNPDYSGFRNAVPQMSNYYPNIIKNSAEIEVPATEVYNRMGFFGAKPKNPAQQYAILNPAQQAALGYAAEGFVPNFAMEQFASAIGDAFQKAFSPYADKMGSSSNTSNVINVSDQRSYQANTDKIEGIMEFLYKQFPKEMGKFGAVLKK